jgi:excisionase family DNA binding protein
VTPDALPQLVEAVAEQLAPRVAALMAEQSPAPSASPWLDVDEAATYLRLTKDALYKLTGAKAIPHHRIGERIRFRRDELDAWVDDAYVGPPRLAPVLEVMR